jgi:hypothetical protein
MVFALVSNIFAINPRRIYSQDSTLCTASVVLTSRAFSDSDYESAFYRLDGSMTLKLKRAFPF